MDRSEIRRTLGRVEFSFTPEFQEKWDNAISINQDGILEVKDFQVLDEVMRIPLTKIHDFISVTLEGERVENSEILKMTGVFNGHQTRAISEVIREDREDGYVGGVNPAKVIYLSKTLGRLTVSTPAPADVLNAESSVQEISDAINSSQSKSYPVVARIAIVYSLMSAYEKAADMHLKTMEKGRNANSNETVFKGIVRDTTNRIQGVLLESLLHCTQENYGTQEMARYMLGEICDAVDGITTFTLKDEAISTALQALEINEDVSEDNTAEDDAFGELDAWFNEKIAEIGDSDHIDASQEQSEVDLFADDEANFADILAEGESVQDENETNDPFGDLGDLFEAEDRVTGNSIEGIRKIINSTMLLKGEMLTRCFTYLAEQGTEEALAVMIEAALDPNMPEAIENNHIIENCISSACQEFGLNGEMVTNILLHPDRLDIMSMDAQECRTYGMLITNTYLSSTEVVGDERAKGFRNMFVNIVKRLAGDREPEEDPYCERMAQIKIAREGVSMFENNEPEQLREIREKADLNYSKREVQGAIENMRHCMSSWPVNNVLTRTNMRELVRIITTGHMVRYKKPGKKLVAEPKQRRAVA